MNVTVNGCPAELVDGLSVAALVAERAPDHRRVAVAVNADVVPRSAWPSTLLHQGDTVELLRAVAGRVVSMHASDRYLADGATLDELRQTDGTLGYSPNLRHGVTGKGLNDYDAIFRILAEHGYDGWISIEDGMNGMEEMAESLAFLRRKVAEHFPR